MSTNYPNIRSHLVTCFPNEPENAYVQAKGCTLTDEAGTEYLNLNDISCSLGYGHPRFTAELAQLVQTKMLAHPGSYSPEKEKLIANFMSVTHSHFDKIAITANGGEAIDWAIKTARKHTGRDSIVTFRKALHGRSFVGAYISDIPRRKEPFGTGLEHVTFWDSPGDGRSWEPASESTADIAAIIIEPYQAIGGMGSPSPEYWQWLRQYTKERGIVLILDEIQTGFGKTGSFFAYEELGIVPDILLAGKGMSNGFGLGAMLLNEEVGTSLLPHEMAGGSADNDLMCSIVNLVFDIYRDEGIVNHVRELGTLARQVLSDTLTKLDIPFTFYGKGLFFALELPEGMAEAVWRDAKAQHILLGLSAGRLQFRAPLVLTREELLRACGVIAEAVSSQK